MTKYILAGGNDRATDQYWLDLGKAVGDLEKPHILSCFFAQPRENWEDRFASFEPFFKKAFGDGVKCKLASPDNFRNQVKEADIVYLHGGDDVLLKYYLDQFSDLATMFVNKVVIGSSAGADFLSNQYWPCDWRNIRQGSGLTPLNVIVHYGSEYGKNDPRGPVDWEVAKHDLVTATGNSDVTELPEGTFVVYDT